MIGVPVYKHFSGHTMELMLGNIMMKHIDVINIWNIIKLLMHLLQVSFI